MKLLFKVTGFFLTFLSNRSSFLARETLSQDTNQRGMTTDDQIQLALRWSVTDVTKDQFISNTFDWQDSKRVRFG